MFQETRYKVVIRESLADDPNGDGDGVIRRDLIPSEMARAIGEMLVTGGREAQRRRDGDRRGCRRADGRHARPVDTVRQDRLRVKDST